MDDQDTVERLAKKYFRPENLPQQPKLPVNKYWSSIQQCIRENPVTIVVGSTGCGKTTQIPQLLLENELHKNRKPCRIIITQPRKIAAISVSHTVCKDRKWTLGSVCGYQVGMDREVSEDTCIQYVTTNILVERIIHTKSLDRYTHIIIDEIHERHQDLDCLLYLLKSFSKEEDSPKIILMSATAESKLYSKYFEDERCQRISIEGSMYSTEKRYLEDLPPHLGNRINSFLAGKVANLERTNRMLALQTDVLKCVAELIVTFDETDKGSARGAVLIFMPGIAEIRQMIRVLNTFKDAHNYELIPLHSKVPLEEQNRAFRKFSDRIRKIIVATNIAESSITVPDIKFVIDFCLTKCQVMDKNTSFASYQIENCSQASCEQRAGRAGRVQNGIVYRLVMKRDYDTFSEYTTPEILRCPVDISVLKIKKFGLEKPKEVLTKFISPPDPEDVKKAIITLKEVQAMQLEHKGKVDTEDGDLTIIGRVMASLPLDIRLSKLILMGFAFGCYEECVKMAACLSVDDILVPGEDAMKNYKERIRWARGYFSDPLLLMHAFDAYLTKKEQAANDEFRVLKQWAADEGLQIRQLAEAYHVYEELKARLQNIGFIQPSTPNLTPRDPSLQNFCISLALCGAFYPYYFSQQPIDIEKIKLNLSDHDPLNTMVISGLPDRYGPLYAQAIRSKLKGCLVGDVELNFKGSDVFLTFVEDDENGSGSGCTEFPLSAYFCEFYQRRHRCLSVPRIKDSVGERLLKEMNIANLSTETVSVLPIDRTDLALLNRQPFPSDRVFRGQVLWFVDLLTVFVSLEERVDKFNDMQNEIQDERSQGTLVRESKPEIGQLVLAEFEGVLYRARITKGDRKLSGPEWMNRGKDISVFFIDFGNSARVAEVFKIRESMLFTNSEGPFAYKCHLAQLQVPDGSARPPTTALRELVGKPCAVEVFSIVDDILRVELTVEDDEEPINVNEKLIREKCVIRIEEPDFYKTSVSEFKPKCIQNLVVTGEAYIDENEYSLNQMLLNGPRTPLTQMLELKSLNKTRKYSTIEIVQGGINQIMFGETGCHRRFLVAHSAKMSADYKRLQLLRTTLMPKLPMMLSFVTLVFTPRAEYRCNREKTKYIGAICGMGGIEKVREGERGNDDTGSIESMFPQSDLELPFSQELGRRDVDIINEIRRLLNEAFCGNNEVFEWSSVPILKIQKKILDYTLLFFNEKNRTELPQVKKKQLSPDAYKWGLLKKEDKIEDDTSKRQILFRPHCTARIRNEKMYKMLQLTASFMEQLNESAAQQLCFCPVCFEFFDSKDTGRRHLMTPDHEQAYAKLKGLAYEVRDD